MPVCFKCLVDIKVMKVFTKHVKFHGVMPKSKMYCVNDDCNGLEFSCMSNFVRHFKRKHKYLRKSKINHRNTAHNLDFNYSDSVDESVNSVNLENKSEHIKDSLGILNNTLKLFISKLYSNLTIPRNQVQFLFETVITLMIDVLSISLSCTSNPDLERPEKIILRNIEIVTKELSTEYRRLKLFEKDGTYIPPVPICVGNRLIPLNKNKKLEHCLQRQQIPAHFIPLRLVLSKFMHQPLVMKKIIHFLNQLTEETDCLSNFMQGDYWRNREKSKDVLTLPLFLFGDDYTCGNVLGSHGTIHKLGAMYVILPFLPNEFRSTLKNIFLLYLYHSSDRKEVKNDKMFAVLIDEFKFLAETGIHVDVPEFTGLVYFSLGLLIGDNLGLHEMAGFAGGFTANHPCRMCTISRQEMFTKCDDKSLILRDKDNYNLAIEQASLYETGINESCIWNSIPNFHATENLGVDIMHDMMEGTSKYVLTAIINFYLKRGYFTLPFLNNRIEGFNYGLVDKSSKPPCLSSSSANEVNLKLSASESFNLVKYFGMLIGDKIPAEDPVWELYIKHRQILGILMAPFFVKDQLCILNDLISIHHNLFIDISPDKKLKNKFHHMIHYHTFMSKFGPLRHLSSIRGEARHRLGKLIADSVHNQQNLTLSISIREQLLLHYYLLNDLNLKKRFECALPSSVTFSELTDFDYFKYIIPENFNENCEMTSWINLNGTKYKPNMVLFVDIKDGVPRFGRIVYIFLTNCKVGFLCRQLETLYFDRHYYGHRVVESNDTYCFINYSDMVHYSPTAISTVAGEFFVVSSYDY